MATRTDGTDGNSRKGFASLSPERRREISSQGGKTAHRLGRAHRWTKAEAKLAGRKGGTISRGGRGRLATHGAEDPGV